MKTPSLLRLLLLLPLFFPSVLAGVGDRTIVIMSRGTALGDQIVSPESAYPSEWIAENW